MPRMPLCGGLMIGVVSSEPKTPPLVMVNVPPDSSCRLSLPSLVAAARRLISVSIFAKDICSTLRNTGTARPRSVLTAMPRFT